MNRMSMLQVLDLSRLLTPMALVVLLFAACSSETPVPKTTEPVQITEEEEDSGALDTMQEMVYFAHDESKLNNSAKSILDDKVAIFRSNLEMRITIIGFASQPGTEKYNMALGMRRAEAARAYLVSQGVDASRVQITTLGEGQLAVKGPGEIANAQNRRNQFRLLIADPLEELEQ